MRTLIYMLMSRRRRTEEQRRAQLQRDLSWLRGQRRAQEWLIAIAVVVTFGWLAYQFVLGNL